MKMKSEIELVFFKAEENDGEPVDDLALTRRMYTNKKTSQIDDGLVRDVVDLVQTQVVDEVSQLQTEDDASTASTNLSRFRINEIVESRMYPNDLFTKKRSEYTEGQVPRNIPRNMSVGIFLSIDVYMSKNASIDERPRKYPDEVLP
uniref:Uncharacterized protein n=1 Tax=Brassica oleracea var. oleracea TaxID=109376 RepID=A0A0D3B4W1_BRAOL